MKTLMILAGFLGMLILFGCSKSELTETKPIIPNPVNGDVDIDEDGIADYKIEYLQALIFSPNSDQAIYGQLNPYRENSILHNKERRNLFLRNLDEIQELVEEPLFWNNKGFTETIVSITNNAEGEWPIEWKVNTDIERSTYFLGLKFITNNETRLGWVEIDISRTDGNVTVVNKGIM